MVTIISVNDAPPVANNDSFATPEDTALSISSPGILANDTDVDGDPRTALLVSSVSQGTLTLNANGSFIYTPNANYHGSDAFSYRATDGIATGNVAIVNLTVTPVNDAPMAGNDITNTLEDVSVRIKALLNDSDTEGTSLTISGATTTNGTAIVSGTDIIFTPATNFNGTTVFSYSISDGTNSASASVTVAVVAVDDPPYAINDVTNTLEDVSVSVSVLLNDVEPDGARLTITDAFSTQGTVVISGTNIIFTPTLNFFGTALFSYTISDGTSSAPATVSVTVTPVNDAPVGSTDAYKTWEDVALAVPAPGVLQNDTDIENGPLTALLVTDVSHGTLSLSPNGSFTYTPGTNYFGGDSFTYRVSDGIAQSPVTTVSLTTTVTTPLRFVSTHRTNNGFRVQLAGPSPAVYTVLASSNNVHWKPVSTNVTFTGDVTIFDSAPTDNNRFYTATMGGQATTIIEGNAQGGEKADLRSNKRGAQSFRHGSLGAPTYTLSKIVFWISRSSTLPSAHLTCYIGTGINSGPLPGSGVTINPSAITNATSGSSFQKFEVIYTVPVGPLNAGATYYLNLECDTEIGSRLYVEQAGDGTAYGRGTYFRGGSNEGDDARFEIWGQ